MSLWNSHVQQESICSLNLCALLKPQFMKMVMCDCWNQSNYQSLDARL